MSAGAVFWICSDSNPCWETEAIRWNKSKFRALLLFCFFLYLYWMQSLFYFFVFPNTWKQGNGKLPTLRPISPNLYPFSSLLQSIPVFWCHCFRILESTEIIKDLGKKWVFVMGSHWFKKNWFLLSNNANPEFSSIERNSVMSIKTFFW